MATTRQMAKAAASMGAHGDRQHLHRRTANAAISTTGQLLYRRLPQVCEERILGI